MEAEHDQRYEGAELMTYFAALINWYLQSAHVRAYVRDLESKIQAAHVDAWIDHHGDDF